MRTTDELEQLRRRLRRERARREAAELIGERVTSDLYRTVEELRLSQQELAEQSERRYLLNLVARRLAESHDVEGLLSTAVAVSGVLLGLTWCGARLEELGASTSSFWRADDDTPRRADPQLPTGLADLLGDAFPESAVQVDDVTLDARLSASDPVEAELGGRGFAAVPVRVAGNQAGWLLLVSQDPRAWSPRELALAEGICQEVGIGVLRLRSSAQQASLRRLEELDRAKDALIGNVSHELRTPLASITGYVEVLESGDLGELGPSAAAALAVIARNADRLSRLVENLLQASTQDRRGVLDLDEVDLVELTQQCVATLGPAADRRGVELVVALPPQLDTLSLDRIQIEQVVLNVVDNAVKFTEPGGRVVVSLAVEQDTVVLTVADTGIGIPEAELPAVFSRFFRSSLSVSGEIQGTGLGLALSRSIAELHGGRLSLDSRVGVGTTVRLELPARSAD